MDYYHTNWQWMGEKVGCAGAGDEGWSRFEEPDIGRQFDTNSDVQFFVGGFLFLTCAFHQFHQHVHSVLWYCRIGRLILCLRRRNIN